MRKIQSTVLLLSLLIVGLSAGAVWSQPATSQPGGTGAGGGGGFGRGGGTAAMIERMSGFIKEQLGASDDEWKVMEPRLEKVVALKMEGTGLGMMGMGRMRGGQGGGGQSSMVIGGTDLSKTDVAKATQDLRDLMENKNATPDQIKAKLAALRTAREAAKAELAKAQDDLRGILNLNQEAQLVILGLLD